MVSRFGVGERREEKVAGYEGVDKVSPRNRMVQDRLGGKFISFSGTPSLKPIGGDGFRSGRKRVQDWWTPVT